MIPHQPAVYSTQRIQDFQGNPLIEALPPSKSQKEVAAMLSVLPSYSQEERQYPAEDRLLLTQHILHFHVPGEQDIIIFQSLSACLRWGYRGRNPLSAGHVRLINQTWKNKGKGQSCSYEDMPYFPNTYGFLIYGVSGIGKTCTVENILGKFPQVIQHREYRGIPLPERQVVWVKIDTPPDGSLKSLCLNFFREMDRLLGTAYEANNRKHILDVMLSSMKHVACVENVGILVIDEAHHLCTAKASVSEAALNFYVSLVNTIGLPVILIGTPKICSLISRDFQQAKRASGQGNVYWARMGNDVSWERFSKAMWRFQYTNQSVPITRELSDALYEESFGIPFLAAQIYRLVQIEAIRNGSETFDHSCFRKAADKHLHLSADIRSALRSGKDVDISALLGDASQDSWFRDWNIGMAREQENPAKPPMPEQDVWRKAASTLQGLGIAPKDADVYIALAMDEQNGIAEATVIARKAWEFYLEHLEKPTTRTPVITGYEGLDKSGWIEKEAI